MNKLAPFLIYFILLISCAPESIEETSVEYPSIDVSKMEQGRIRIKITEDFAVNLEQQADLKGRITSTSVKSSDDILFSLGIEYMQRLFPPAGEFEARTRKEGLHLWYDVHFDDNTPLTKAKVDISSIEGVSYIEYAPRVVPIRSNLKTVIDMPTTVNPTNTTTKSELYFNDPGLPEQWHYFNDGSRAMSIRGADINILPVWKTHISNIDLSDIVVSIVDGGIDIQHEDLIDNLWINPNSGTEGKHGWNFVDDSPTITADDHGTHVAGIVGAVNNNAKGVAGIAGGDAKKGIKGVRLMSCQIFEGNTSGNEILAIKYGADNGAIISQNSWAYDDVNKLGAASKDAIDYFIKYAGTDKSGNQVGPMKGGIVIFAAGNKNAKLCYPAQYEGVMAVSALDASFKKADYSNYGDWVDIAAPGGSYQEGQHYIISTLTSNKYGGMEGTSMACPHVSGVAALLISHFGGPGFTSQMLWNKLLFTTNDEIYNYDNPLFIGNGLLDAQASFLTPSTTPPNIVTDLRYLVISNKIDLEYSVPTDPDGGKLLQTTIYYSDQPFRKDLDKSNLPAGVNSIKYRLFNYNAGDTFLARISNLLFSAKYYVAVDTEDMSGNKSELSDIIEVNIGGNNPPQITLTHDDNVLNVTDKVYELDMSKFFYDPDGESLEYVITSSNEDIFTATIKNDIVTFTFAKVGSANITIVARDDFGGAASIKFKMLIRDLRKAIDIYPNPVFNTLNFRMGDNQDAIVSIYGASGSMLLKKEISISPFTPAQIDLASLSAGSYIVRVNYDNKEIRKNIVKL